MSEHAIGNAKAWLASIAEAIAALALAEESEEVTEGEFAGMNADDIRARIEEDALSVQIRNGWYSPGDPDKGEPDEYEILLTTGGPALRIVGELNSYSEVHNARLQWQDWGTPWTNYIDTTEEEDEAIEAYARCFYFGA